MKRPAGYTVGDFMTPDVVTLSPEDNLALAHDVLKLGRIRHLPVTEHGKLVGLVTHRDLLKALASERPVALARDAMTREVRCVSRGTPLRRAIRLMLDHKFGCLPVVDREANLVGILTEADVLGFAANLARDLEETTLALRAVEHP